MSRRTRAEKREIAGDPRYESVVAQKFINGLMLDGKKSTAESIFYRRPHGSRGAFGTTRPGSVQPGPEQRQACRRGEEQAGRRRHIPGADRSPPRATPGAGHKVDDRLFPQAGRAVDGGSPRGRDSGREPKRGKHDKEEGRHAPDGRSQQGVRPLSLVAVSQLRRAGWRRGSGGSRRSEPSRHKAGGFQPAGGLARPNLHSWPRSSCAFFAYRRQKHRI